MSWDYSLQKKYNSTSHFRLLKQLRNDLKSDGQQPLQNHTADKKTH